MRHCGYCGRRGHNKRGCPEIKTRIRENPNGYLAKQAQQKEVNKKPRECSYCHKPLHNKTTCQVLIKDRAIQAKLSQAWRREFLQLCIERGFGVGTLLKYRDPETMGTTTTWAKDRILRGIERHGEYALVSALRWEVLDHRQNSRPMQSITVRFPTGFMRTAFLPIEFSDIVNKYDTPHFEIVGTIDSSPLGDSLPDKWHDGRDSADWHLRI